MSPKTYLEAVRRRNGWTYAQLAEQIDYDNGNLCRMMHHERYNMKVETACKIARRLGVSVEVLMGLEQEESGKPIQSYG